MFEVLGVLYLVWLQVLHCMLKGFADAVGSAASIIQIYFGRVAHRHDEKYSTRKSAPVDPVVEEKVYN